MKLTTILVVLRLLTPASAEQESNNDHKIYFVPIRNDSDPEINDIVADYRQKFQLEGTVLPELTSGPPEISRDRHQ